MRPLLLPEILLLQDGFAARDGSHRLLRYWSALERLYVEESGRESSNQKIVDRASVAELDSALSRWKLNHVAQLRHITLMPDGPTTISRRWVNSCATYLPAT